MVVRKLPKGEECALKKGTVIALGCFDGLHRGHKALLRLAKREAEKRSVPFAVWSPEGGKSGTKLTERAEKLSALFRIGAEYYIEEPFEEIKDLSAEDFFSSRFVSEFGASVLCCGENFTFGRGAKGDAALLKTLCEKNGIGFCMQKSVKEHGETVSSAEIRHALEEGNAEKARKLLGRAYSFFAVVTEGRKVGRTMGFPTLNLPLPENCPISCGVYAAKVTIPGGRRYFAVADIGVHPTFERASKPLCEAHLLRYEEKKPLYGKRVKISFIKKLREERAFSSCEELKKQLQNDIETAEELFGS